MRGTSSETSTSECVHINAKILRFRASFPPGEWHRGSKEKFSAKQNLTILFTRGRTAEPGQLNPRDVRLPNVGFDGEQNK